MKNKNGIETSALETILKAKLRMSILLFVFYILCLIGAYLTFPFIGFTSSCQNVAYGLMAGAPFMIILIISIVSIRRELSSIASTKN
jgi:hypothetical protein